MDSAERTLPRGLWRLAAVPDLRIVRGHHGPDLLKAVFHRVDVVGHRLWNDEVMRDDATRGIRARERIGKAEGDPIAAAPAHDRFPMSSGEGAFVHRERIGVRASEQEAESPGAATRGPDEAYHELLTRTRSSVGVLGAYSNIKETSSQIDVLVRRARKAAAPRPERRPRRVWRPKELPAETQAAILDAYAAGRTMKSLALEFGVHRTTIRAALDRHGVLPRDKSMSDPQISEAVRRYEDGESLAKVGGRLGFDAQTIANQLRKRGVRIRESWERR